MISGAQWLAPSASPASCLWPWPASSSRGTVGGERHLGVKSAGRGELPGLSLWMPHPINMVSLRCPCKAAGLLRAGPAAAQPAWGHSASRQARAAQAAPAWEHTPSFSCVPTMAPAPRPPCALLSLPAKALPSVILRSCSALRWLRGAGKVTALNPGAGPASILSP